VLLTHRQKTTVSLLRRGQVFGDQALLNNERRSTSVAPTANTTLLVVNKEVGAGVQHLPHHSTICAAVGRSSSVSS
jgi:hypothetical protein